jgi:hypothetical protein
MAEVDAPVQNLGMVVLKLIGLLIVLIIIYMIGKSILKWVSG